MDQDTLRAAADAAFEAAFEQDPTSIAAWPDPHADHEPDPQEYSRCLDPAKYRVLAIRAGAWTRVLADAGLATPEPVDLTRPDDTWRDGSPSGITPIRAHRLRPHQRGAIPLVLSFRGFDGPDDNLLTISAGEPAVPLATVPACGCDACDDGSEHLLAEVDEHVLGVVTGDFVHVSTPRLTAFGTSRGWQASATDDDGDGLGQVDQLLQDARAGRSPHRVVHGARWW
ncbi:DUF6226 family protein [Kineococcus sp. LSe6-4]|uniref:DUF6226 family protein n=1 Tax=Kineococcus halophytocola TaxID=3234027 RepID=A0ABV4H126_9ACTN